MAKKFKVSEKILLFLSFCADELIDLVQEGASKKRRSIYYDPWLGPGYKPSNLRQRYYQLLKTGYLEKIIKKGQPYFRITSKAKSSLKRDFPLFEMQKQKWDQKWRMVIFDISEQLRYQRDVLRAKLLELGFGKLQKSIYISPYDFVQDMYEFLKARNLLGKVFVLTAKHELMGDPEELANLVWKIDDLEDKYWDLWQKIKDMNDLTKDDQAKATQDIKNEYWLVLQSDPCLPFELLPQDWIGEKARGVLIGL